jgi:hypothetical protein
VRCESRLGNGQQALLPGIGKPGGLRHVDGVGGDARRERPGESVEEAGEREQDESGAEVVARARAPAGAEDVEAVVGEPGRVGGAGPARRVEPERVRPDGPVAPGGEEVEQNGAALGDVVACQRGVLHGVPREREAVRRVQAQRLLHDAYQVAQLRQVAFLHDAVASHHRVQFVVQLPLDLGVPDDLRHGPLVRHRRRVRPRQQILDEKMIMNRFIQINSD